MQKEQQQIKTLIPCIDKIRLKEKRRHHNAKEQVITLAKFLTYTVWTEVPAVGIAMEKHVPFVLDILVQDVKKFMIIEIDDPHHRTKRYHWKDKHRDAFFEDMGVKTLRFPVENFSGKKKSDPKDILKEMKTKIMNCASRGDWEYARVQIECDCKHSELHHTLTGCYVVGCECKVARFHELESKVVDDETYDTALHEDKILTFVK